MSCSRCPLRAPPAPCMPCLALACHAVLLPAVVGAAIHILLPCEPPSPHIGPVCVSWLAPWPPLHASCVRYARNLYLPCWLHRLAGVQAAARLKQNVVPDSAGQRALKLCTLACRIWYHVVLAGHAARLLIQGFFEGPAGAPRWPACSLSRAVTRQMVLLHAPLPPKPQSPSHHPHRIAPWCPPRPTQ